MKSWNCGNMEFRKRFWRVSRPASCVLATLVVCMFACCAAFAAPETFPVRAVSYNVRYKTSDDTGSKSWDSRKVALCNLLKNIDPDVIGFQEVDPPQMTDLKALLPDYEIFGKHREADNTRRGTPVAYKKSRFELLDGGTFWLSTTPNVPGSRALGGGCTGTDPETCTWALLRDRDTRGVFCFFSTHLDYRQAECRKRQMAIAVAKVMALFERGVPAVLVGDMNCYETEDAVALVACSSLNDACLVSQTAPTGPWRTFNSWTYKSSEVSCVEALANYSAAERSANTATFGGKRIDYILTAPGIETEKFAIRNDPQPGKEQYPSDHFPIVADLAMPCDRAWFRESVVMNEWMGEWSEAVTYATDGKAYLYNTVFTPYFASTGKVVTVEATVQFSEDIEDRTPDADAQAAVRLSTNGCFQVWAGNPPAWVDVETEGATPVSGEEYTLRVKFDYAAGTYSVFGQTFPLAVETNCISSVGFIGDTLFKSLAGYEAIGFEPGEITVADATVILDAAKSAWLNARGDYDAVSDRLANITSDEFATAWLCNLDIMNADASAKLSITHIDVGSDSVIVGVTLERTGAVAQKINGVLKFYGASTLAAFKNDTAEPVSSQTLVNDDFSESDTATATFQKGDNTFFNAKIEEDKNAEM